MKEELCFLKEFVYFKENDDDEVSTNDWEIASEWLEDGKKVYAHIFLPSINRDCITSPVEKLDSSKRFFITLTGRRTRTKYVIKRE